MWTMLQPGRESALTIIPNERIECFISNSPILEMSSGQFYLCFKVAPQKETHGEAPPQCLPVNTGPASWLNWNPTEDIRFKRQSAFWLSPYVEPKDVPPKYY